MSSKLIQWQKYNRDNKPTVTLSNAIINHLRANGHDAVKVHVIGLRGRRIATASRGVADIVAVLKPNGKHLEIDVKIGRDKPSEYQMIRQERVQEKGGLYWFIKCFTEFEQLYNNIIRKEIYE